jgi:copper(I)-binding protein
MPSSGKHEVGEPPLQTFATLSLPRHDEAAPPGRARGGRHTVGITAPLGSRPETIPLRRFLLLAFLLLASLALTGCNGGFDAQTQQVYQAAAGISNRDSEVYVLNALVVTDGKGNGTVAGTLLDQAKQADTLQSVTAVDSSGQKISAKLASPLPLPPAQSVKLETDGAVRLTGSSLQAGYLVTVTFTFANAAPLTMTIPVVADSADYTSVPVGPA